MINIIDKSSYSSAKANCSNADCISPLPVDSGDDADTTRLLLVGATGFLSDDADVVLSNLSILSSICSDALEEWSTDVIEVEDNNGEDFGSTTCFLATVAGIIALLVGIECWSGS